MSGGELPGTVEEESVQALGGDPGVQGGEGFQREAEAVDGAFRGEIDAVLVFDALEDGGLEKIVEDGPEVGELQASNYGWTGRCKTKVARGGPSLKGMARVSY